MIQALVTKPGTGVICFEKVFPFDGISVIFPNLALVSKSKYFDKTPCRNKGVFLSRKFICLSFALTAGCFSVFSRNLP